MSERHQRFCAVWPDMHPDVRRYFPEFDYRNVRGGDPAVLLNYRDPGNMVGHQQRAFTCWWAIEKCGPLDLGLDFGSHRGLTPLCAHVDKWYDNANAHPFYGGVVPTDIVVDIADREQLKRFSPRTFPCIVASHVLEHMPGPDANVVDLLCHWHGLLRQGGALVLVVPDQAHIDVMRDDKDHKSAWTHDDFRPRILDPFLSRTGAREIEHNTLRNNFSFNTVVERTAP